MIKIKLHLALSPLPRSEYAESPWDYWDFGGSHRVIPSQQTLKGQNKKCETFFGIKIVKSALPQFDIKSEQSFFGIYTL